MRAHPATALLLVLLGNWLLTLAVAAGRWTNDPVYAYGWFVPFLCLGFAVRRLSVFLAGTGSTIGPNSPLNRSKITAALILGAFAILPFEILRRDFFFL